LARRDGGHVAGKLSIVLYGMLKNMAHDDERKHRDQLGLPSAADQANSVPVDDSQTGLVADPSRTHDHRLVLSPIAQLGLKGVLSYRRHQRQPLTDGSLFVTLL
jgi:hypothetical protein